ncbi:ankyrin repeat-containing domain protein [Lipomyces japonicus]|uniref:ankyrin repeat-containing domain protein n=1 Tax=Lipomyces japonicus TaxID=56871 RepID=UPI0034CE7EA0
MATPNIWTAASDNNRAVVESYISSGKHTPNDRDASGYTPLHAAASYSHVDLLRYLVSNGGEINLTDEDGETPLFVVETAATAKVLVEELKADWRVRNVEGFTALEKFEKEIEEDGEQLEEVVEYLKTLESQVSTDDISKLQDELNDVAAKKGTEVRYTYEPVAELGENDLDPVIAERRKRIEELLKSENPEEGIRNLVEEAVRLQLSENTDEGDDVPKERESRRRRLDTD